MALDSADIDPDVERAIAEDEDAKLELEAIAAPPFPPKMNPA